MNKIFFVNVTVLMLLANISFSQNLSTKDSISNFYRELIENLQTKYLNRNEINWDKVESYALKNALTAKNFEESLTAVSLVFDSIKCNHCQLFSEKSFYKSSLNKSLYEDDFSREFLLKYQEQPPFEVKLVIDNIGYIQIPEMLMLDLTKDSLNLETQKMYDQIVNLVKENTIEGWIVDLRFNTGGNVYPMLASLHYILGDNIVYKELDALGNIIKTNQLKNGGFYCGENLEAKAKTSVMPNLKIPVAIIIGKMTGSSGEDIAVAFKNRNHTIFIGENTYGYLTGNDLIELPYNSKMALTTCYIVDNNNIYREFIIPDVTVNKNDNFEELSKDKKIIKAIDFFKTKKE